MMVSIGLFEKSILTLATHEWLPTTDNDNGLLITPVMSNKNRSYASRATGTWYRYIRLLNVTSNVGVAPCRQTQHRQLDNSTGTPGLRSPETAGRRSSNGTVTLGNSPPWEAAGFPPRISGPVRLPINCAEHDLLPPPVVKLWLSACTIIKHHQPFFTISKHIQPILTVIRITHLRCAEYRVLQGIHGKILTFISPRWISWWTATGSLSILSPTLQPFPSKSTVG